MTARYIVITFVLYFFNLRNSNGCNSYIRGTPKPPLRLYMSTYGHDSITCTSKGKESNDMLEIIEYSDDYGGDKTLGATINNVFEIKVNKKMQVYCRVRNGYNTVLTKTQLYTVVFEPDEETDVSTTSTTVVTSTAIATTLFTTLSEEAINVLPLQNDTNILDHPTDLGSKLSSPMVIGGLVTIGILLVILLTGVIICFKRRRLLDISKDDMTDTKHVIQYVQLELETATYSNGPFTKETPYAEIVGVVKKK